MNEKSEATRGGETVIVSTEKIGQMIAHCPLQVLAPLAGMSFAK
jgi:hypothetical protein